MSRWLGPPWWWAMPCNVFSRCWMSHWASQPIGCWHSVPCALSLQGCPGHTDRSTPGSSVCTAGDTGDSGKPRLSWNSRAVGGPSPVPPAYTGQGRLSTAKRWGWGA